MVPGPRPLPGTFLAFLGRLRHGPGRAGRSGASHSPGRSGSNCLEPRGEEPARPAPPLGWSPGRPRAGQQFGHPEASVDPQKWSVTVWVRDGKPAGTSPAPGSPGARSHSWEMLQWRAAEEAQSGAQMLRRRGAHGAHGDGAAGASPPAAGSPAASRGWRFRISLRRQLQLRWNCAFRVDVLNEKRPSVAGKK